MQNRKIADIAIGYHCFSNRSIFTDLLEIPQVLERMGNLW